MIIEQRKIQALANALGISPYLTLKEYNEILDECKKSLCCNVLDYGTEDIKNIISSIWETIKKFFRWVIDTVKSIFKKFTNFIKVLIAKAKEMFNKIFNKQSIRITGLNFDESLVDDSDSRKDRLSVLLNKLKEELQKYKIENYVSIDELKTLQNSYDELHNIVVEITSSKG